MSKTYKDTQALEGDIYSSYYYPAGGSAVVDAEGEQYATFGGDMTNYHLDGGLFRLRDGEVLHYSRLSYPVTIDWRNV